MKANLQYISTFTHTSNSRHNCTLHWFDKTLSAIMIFLLSPLMIANGFIALVNHRSVFTDVYKIDALGHSVIMLHFTCGAFRRSALLISIYRGDLSFCGVPLTHSLRPQDQAKINQHFLCNPGIYSLYDLHQRTGLVDNEPEELLLKQFNLSTFDNIFILFKSLVCFCFYGRRKKSLIDEKILPLFGLNLNNTTMKAAVNWATTSNEHPIQSPAVNNLVRSSSNKNKVRTNIGFFINVNSINISLSQPKFHQKLEQADMLLADGSGMRLAAKSAGYALKDNTNGTDMLPHLCKSCVKKSKSLYFIGAKPGVAAKAASVLRKQYPGLIITGTQHGFIQPNQFKEHIKNINESGCDILLVAMGSPFQEEWLLEHREQLHCQTALAVGGLFDFYSGNIARAPLWIRELGMEWVWRLLQEPVTKFKRYVIGTPLFLFRIYVLGLASKGAQ
jgi:N-acetylglucosaminyldiphosphoundecaprenol N-acetyl-beta-D-mannosaminyltransferase